MITWHVIITQKFTLKEKQVDHSRRKWRKGYMLQCSAVCSRVGKKYDVCTCLQQERGSGTEWNEDSKLVELEDVHSSSEKHEGPKKGVLSPLISRT